MNYDVEYEIFKYICKEADEYVSLKELLNNHHLTFQEALQKVNEYKKNFFDLLDKYEICPDNVVSICMDLIELLKKSPGDLDLQYIYSAVITDHGLLLNLNPDERTEEQNIRNWISQKESVDELMTFFQQQSIMKDRLSKIFQILKKPYDNPLEYEYTEEQDDILHITMQYDFLNKGKNNRIYSENISELVHQVNGRSVLQALKPYLISAVLSRKHTLMLEREHYIPNLQSVFQYQQYQIEKDNGKNFDTYQSYVELYEHLRRYYLDSQEVDIAFSDYCFANFSPLSEWYYQNCEQNEPIPMNLIRKIITMKSLIFPMILSYHDYEEMNEDEIQLYHDAGYQLEEQMLEAAEYLI